VIVIVDYGMEILPPDLQMCETTLQICETLGVPFCPYFLAGVT